MRAVLLVLLCAAVATADESPAVAAARRRQEALQSVEFNVRLNSEREMGTLRLVLDGPRARMEHRITGKSSRTWSAATDGTRVKQSLVWDDPARGESAGSINPPGEGVCRGGQLLPLTLATRPLDPIHCPFPVGSLTPAGTEEIDGRMCDVFNGSAAVVPEKFWFDPAAGYSLRRFRHNGMVTDVESSTDNPAGVWLPTKYTVSITNGAGRVEVNEYTVERVEVGKKYPDAEFDPLWPAGVMVYDLTGGGKAFVSDGTGTLQPAHTIDMVWDWVARLWWLPVAFVGLTAGLVGWRMWRRRKLS